MIGLIIAVAVAAMVVLYIYNILKSLKNMVYDGFAKLDAQLKRRYELIPDFVALVKSYSALEQDALESVIRAMSSVGTYSNLSLKEKLRIDEAIGDNISRLISLGDSYTNLRLTDGFEEISNELAKLEEELVKSRRYYNACISTYNMKLQQFPNTLFAEAFGFETMEDFATMPNEIRR